MFCGGGGGFQRRRRRSLGGGGGRGRIGRKMKGLGKNLNLGVGGLKVGKRFLANWREICPVCLSEIPPLMGNLNSCVKLMIFI